LSVNQVSVFKKKESDVKYYHWEPERMKSLWIEHQGKRVFYADYSDFGNDHVAIQKEVDEAVSAISCEPEKSVLVLVSFEDTDESISNLAVMRKLVTRANNAVLKRALLGVNGSRRFFITTFANVTGGTQVMAFDTREKALDWLVGV
jgi:hypothetical protein